MPMMLYMGDFREVTKPLYGFDAYGNLVDPENGYRIVLEGDIILVGDKPFDVYAGWIESNGWHAKMGRHAQSRGRWTTWERKVEES